VSKPETESTRLTAWVHGRVLVVARGPRVAGERLLELLRSDSTPGTVNAVVAEFDAAGDVPTPAESGFCER